MFNNNYYYQGQQRPTAQWMLPPQLIHLLQLKQMQQFQSQCQLQQCQTPKIKQQNVINNVYSQIQSQGTPIHVKQEASVERSLLHELCWQQQQRVSEQSNLFRELLGQKQSDNSISTASESGDSAKQIKPEVPCKQSTDTPRSNEYQELFQSLHQILQYLSQHADTENMSELNRMQDLLCAGNYKLALVWDALVEKYRNTEKTKEEMTKFVLRKSLKFMKEQCWKKEGKCKKEENKRSLDDAFFQTYFDKETFDKILKQRKEREKHGKKKTKADQVETLQDLIMPFRKKSVIKTMNNEFLKQIFSFEKFSLGFLKFISYYMVVALKDNSKKINNTARKIVWLIINDKFSNNSLKTFKRIPWLQTWINKSEKVAQKFIHYISKKNFISSRDIIHKRIKTDLAKLENRKRSLSL